MSMRPIQKDSTDQSVVIRIIDSTSGLPETAVEHDTAGIDLWYRREGATKTAITEAALAALDSAHSDGGIEHIADGYYRLDLPDAAVATGANGVMVGGAVTGMIVIGCYIPLVDYDPYDSVRAGLTALPNAAADAAGGLPISDAGDLDLDSMDANITTIAGDVLNLDGAAMRGTDGANTVTPDAAGTAASLHSTTDGKIDALNNVSSQDVRDAMKLAPTGGAAAAGSVDTHLDTIETDTDELQTNQGNWNTATGFATPTNVTDSQTAIIAEIDANETKIDTVDSNVDTLVGRLTALRAGYLDNLNGHTPQTGDTFAALPTNFSDLSITVTTGRVDVASIEGSDATDQIRDSIVDDATRIDASAINTLSGFAPDNTIADVDDLGGVASETGIETHVTNALNTYDPPTRAEATADKAEIITEVDANETKIDTAQSGITAIQAVTDFLQKWVDNKIAFSGNTMILYDDDGTTALRTWVLSEGNITVSGPYNRAKAT